MYKGSSLPFAHAHHFKAQTEERDGHHHIIIGFSFPASGNDSDEHFHRLEGLTIKNSHQHRFSAKSGPPIPLEGGGHYHQFNGETFSKTKHEHYFSGRTSRVLGNYPDNW